MNISLSRAARPFLSAATLCALASLCHVQTSPAPRNAGAPHPSLPPLRVPDALGTNIHFTDEAPGEAKMIAQGGYRVIRMDFAWNATEREKGVYDWSAYDRLVATLEKNKLKPLFILDYGNALYSPSSKGGPATEEADTPQYRAAFAKWAVAAAAHFKGRGIIWEIWNEPNGGGFWKPVPDAAIYSRLALEASRAIKGALPNECVVGPATSGIDLGFIETCFKMGLLQYWDAVSVHPYRQNAPETANSEYRELRRLIERYKPKGKEMPVLSGEWGYSSAWSGFDEVRQGKYLPRQWLTNLYNRVPVSIWYDWHDDGADPKEPEHHFGSVSNTLHQGREASYDPKPAYTAAQTLSRQLDGFSFNKRLWTGRDDEWVLLFSRGDAVKIAAWSSQPPAPGATTVPPHSLSLPASVGTFSVVDHLGAPRPQIQSERNRLLISVSDSVSYISPREPNALWLRAARWPSVPLEQWVQAPYQPSSRQLATTNIITAITPRAGEASPEPVILRDAEPLRVTTRSPDGFAQVNDLVVTNSLQVLPQAGEAPGSLRVRVQGTGGQAESGSVRVSVPKQKPVTVAYSLAAGEREAIVNVPLAISGDSWVSVVALDAKGRPLVREKQLRFVALDSFSRPAAANDYGVVPDGDMKVASTQSLTQEDAPAPLGGAKVKALKLSYGWSEGWKFVRVLPPATLKLEGRPVALQMWIYGDGRGVLARLRVRDETGQTFQPAGDPQAISWTGWKLVSFALDGSHSPGFWGGANDGIIHGSLAWDSILLLDGAGLAQKPSAIYLANPTLVYEVSG